MFCWQCGEYIGRCYVRIQRAKCELCQRAEAGEPIPPEVLQAYRASKAENAATAANLTYAYIAPEEPSLAATGVKKKFTFSSLAGDVMAALGKFASSALKQKEAPVSKRMADAKRRPRLFSNVSLGDMSTVDKELKKQDK